MRVCVCDGTFVAGGGGGGDDSSPTDEERSAEGGTKTPFNARLLLQDLEKSRLHAERCGGDEGAVVLLVTA